MWTSGEDNAVTRGRVGITGLWGGAEAHTDYRVSRGTEQLQD